MAREINMKRGEGKTLTFTIKNRTTGAIIDVTTATQSLTISSTYGGTPIVQKLDGDFVKTYSKDGKVSVNINTTDSDITPYTYKLELKTDFGTAMLDKSATIDFVIASAVN